MAIFLQSSISFGLLQIPHHIVSIIVAFLESIVFQANFDFHTLVLGQILVSCVDINMPLPVLQSHLTPLLVSSSRNKFCLTECYNISILTVECKYSALTQCDAPFVVFSLYYQFFGFNHLIQDMSTSLLYMKFSQNRRSCIFFIGLLFSI